MRTLPGPQGRLVNPWIARALAAALVAVPQLALADVVGDPPPSCPTGSSPNVCHGGPFCEPAFCMDDGDCTGGWTCQDVNACVGEVNCGGGGRPSPTETFEGACKPDSTCDVAGATCQARRQCLPMPDPTTGGSTDGTATGTASTGDSATGGATGSGGGETESPTGNVPATDGSGGASSGSGDGGDGGKSSCSCNSNDPATTLPWLAVALFAVRRRRSSP